MTLLRNLVLFLVVFLPLACVMGIGAGFTAGPIDTPRVGYQIQLFLFAVLPLLFPSILAVPVVHFALRRFSPERARRLAVLAVPAALFAVHLAIFHDTYWSVPLVVLFAIPGAVYGACFALVQNKHGSTSPT